MTDNILTLGELKVIADTGIATPEEVQLICQKFIRVIEGRDADKKRIAELEARTVSVKFDPIPMEELGNKNQGKQHPYMFGAGYNSAVVSCKCALENACAAAGIKLEVGE